MASRRERTPVDQHLFVAREAATRGDVAEVRGHLRRVMTILALHSNDSYVRAKVREVRRIEATIASTRRPERTRRDGAGPSVPSGGSSALTRLMKQAGRVDYLLAKGQLREARRFLDELRVKVDALAEPDATVRALRTAVRDLADRASRFEAAKRSDRKQATGKAKEAAKKPSPTTASRQSKGLKPAEHFVCDQCSCRRTLDQLVHKPGKRQVCVLCATGQVCPSCRRAKSPDFDLCLRCSGGGGQIKIVYGGAFESNRRKH